MAENPVGGDTSYRDDPHYAESIAIARRLVAGIDQHSPAALVTTIAGLAIACGQVLGRVIACNPPEMREEYLVRSLNELSNVLMMETLDRLALEIARQEPGGHA